MASSSRSVRSGKFESSHQVNLVSARSRSNIEVNRLSRVNSANSYAKMRKKRARRRNILIGIGVTLTSLMIAAVAALGVYAVTVNDRLHTNLQGNEVDFNNQLFEGVFVKPEKPEDPFWILLLGTDGYDWEFDYHRTDTIILVRVDQPNKTIAMVSIPRDTYVWIPDYGWDKINAAYSLGEQEQEGGGVPLTIRTVSEFAGVDIAYFAQINFDGLVRLVDDIGGVDVDVPVDIIDDYDAGGIDIYEGLQTLNGYEALVFCRSRKFDVGDYQRQANQRTFLQALATQVLSSDPVTITTTVTNLANMTYTNMDLDKLIKIAKSFQGMQESAIHTYHVPSYTDMINEISYVLSYDYEWWELITQIDSGDYPAPQEDPYSGVIPDAYIAVEGGMQAIDSIVVNAGDYTVDVRNGCGIAGSARSISDKLAIAGYGTGEIGNTIAYVYPTTLIIYDYAENRSAADDIRKRLGYGKVLKSNNQYSFEGDILVVVGDDFDG